MRFLLAAATLAVGIFGSENTMKDLSILNEIIENQEDKFSTELNNVRKGEMEKGLTGLTDRLTVQDFEKKYKDKLEKEEKKVEEMNIGEFFDSFGFKVLTGEEAEKEIIANLEEQLGGLNKETDKAEMAYIQFQIDNLNNKAELTKKEQEATRKEEQKLRKDAQIEDLEKQLKKEEAKEKRDQEEIDFINFRIEYVGETDEKKKQKIEDDYEVDQLEKLRNKINENKEMKEEDKKATLESLDYEIKYLRESEDERKNLSRNRRLEQLNKALKGLEDGSAIVKIENEINEQIESSKKSLAEKANKANDSEDNSAFNMEEEEAKLEALRVKLQSQALESKDALEEFLKDQIYILEGKDDKTRTERATEKIADQLQKVKAELNKTDFVEKLNVTGEEKEEALKSLDQAVGYITEVEEIMKLETEEDKTEASEKLLKKLMEEFSAFAEE